MNSRVKYKVLILFPMLTVLILAFQNCGRVAFNQSDLSSLNNTGMDNCALNPNAAGCSSIAAKLKCTFNGQEYTEGQSVTAYLASAVASTASCQSETRRCDGGSLTGSYQYSNCVVNAPASCLFNGQTIAHGQSANAFQSSTVAYGATCASEARTCNNGSLSGSYSFASCAPNSPAACLFNGQTLAHGSAVKAFQNSSVAFGNNCVSEDRVCNNGTLTGSYNFASCNVDAAASCLFNGQTIAHGASARAYLTSSVAYGSNCAAQDRTCNNGTLTGSYSFASCNVNAAASCLFNNQTIAHGQSVTAFGASTAPYGSTCSAQSRTCNNGVLSGTYTYASCTVEQAASCLFNGQTIADGQSVTAYSIASVDYGVDSCDNYAQLRTCSNGNLSGSYLNSTCKRNYYQWSTNRAVFGPCGGPPEGGVQACTKNNLGATVIGNYCGSGADAVWTCKAYSF